MDIRISLHLAYTATESTHIESGHIGEALQQLKQRFDNTKHLFFVAFMERRIEDFPMHLGFNF